VFKYHPAQYFGFPVQRSEGNAPSTVNTEDKVEFTLSEYGLKDILSVGS